MTHRRPDKLCKSPDERVEIKYRETKIEEIRPEARRRVFCRVSNAARDGCAGQERLNHNVQGVRHVTKAKLNGILDADNCTSIFARSTAYVGPHAESGQARRTGENPVPGCPYTRP